MFIYKPTSLRKCYLLQIMHHLSYNLALKDPKNLKTKRLWIRFYKTSCYLQSEHDCFNYIIYYEIYKIVYLNFQTNKNEHFRCKP